MYLQSTKAEHLVAGLARSLPANLAKPGALQPWAAENGDFCVVALCFDFASSNVLAYKHFAHTTALEGSRIFLHGEWCATHCIHLVKASCITASHLASMLYSVSRLMTLNRTVDGLRSAFREHVRRSLELRQGPPPPPDETLRADIVYIMGIDEEDGEPGGFQDQARGRPSASYSAIMDM